VNTNKNFYQTINDVAVCRFPNMNQIYSQKASKQGKRINYF